MSNSTIQTIILTAVSLAVPTLSAQAITLMPSRPTAVSVRPGQPALMAGQTRQFSAVDQRGQSTPVSWSIDQPVGSITSDGVYSGPLTVAQSRTVTLTATSTIDPTKTAAVTMALIPNITLPLEVIGPDGTMVTAHFSLPQGVNLAGQLQLSMRIHGLRYETQASLQVNNSAWLPINSTSVSLTPLAAAYGGIGGGFHTLDMTLNLPAGALQPESNTLTFRFNGTDGKVSGFRVLAFNVLGSNGSPLLPGRDFVNDDPGSWQPPSSNPSDIAAGKTLWYQAALTVPTANGPKPIQAHCTSCHPQDGRDLKYFNYSNNSIRSRSLFHGLTAQQGDQIASYIRTMNAPASVNGRPWNPPYQPGPGMDSRPVSEWAAGAGIDAVLAHDADMLPYLLPNDSSANWAWNVGLNAREMPVALQFLDWNHWLPTIHPMDAWGSAFTGSSLNTEYSNIRANLLPNNPASYAAWAVDIRQFSDRELAFDGPLQSNVNSDPATAAALYSTRKWSSVKVWELNQEFGLEGMGRVAFGSQARSDRAWYSNMPFDTSPFLLRIPPGNVGIGNGLKVTSTYLSFAWYAAQLVLNDGNGTYLGSGFPIDWAYSALYPANDLTWDNSNINSPVRTGTGALLGFWLDKALQNATDNTGNPAYLVIFPAQVSTWSEMTTSQKLTIMNTFVGTWLGKFSSWTAQQVFAAGLANPAIDLTQDNLATKLIYALPELRYQGVDLGLLNQVVAWLSSIWPTYNWNGVLNAPCSVGNLGQITCTPAN